MCPLIFSLVGASEASPVVNREAAWLYGLGRAYVCVSRSITVRIVPVLFSVLCPMATKSDEAEPPEAKRQWLQRDKARERQCACCKAETAEQPLLQQAKDRESHRASRQAETAE